MKYVDGGATAHAVEKETLKHALLTRLYKTPFFSRTALRGLNLLFYIIEKVPVLRDRVPLTDPAKNNMTYLPVNPDIVGRTPKTIGIGRSVGEVADTVIPLEVLDRFIQMFSFHRVMDHCICREAFDCGDYPHDVGCLFMGETAKKLPPGLGRPVSAETAREHVRKAVGNGLVPMTGKVNVDNLGFLVPDTRQLFSVCFCCPCCCMMGYYKHSPSHLKKLFRPLEGLTVSVTESCNGCGACVAACIFDNIEIRDGIAHHHDHCAGCGRCRTWCPNDAVLMSLDNPEHVDDVVARLTSFVKIS